MGGLPPPCAEQQSLKQLNDSLAFQNFSRNLSINDCFLENFAADTRVRVFAPGSP